MINIYSNEDQTVVGEAYDDNNNLLENNVKAIIRVDIYNTFDAVAILSLNNRALVKYPKIIFKNKNKDSLILESPRGKISGATEYELTYKITRGTLKGENVKHNKYMSGSVEDLLYYRGEKIELDNMTIECKQVENGNDNYNNTQYYFEIITDDDLDYDSANLLFAMLSAITGAKFFCNMIHRKVGSIELYQRYSKYCRLIIYGSGKLQFPLKLRELLLLNEKLNNKEFLFNFLINYTDFTTSERKEHQLILGCNIIDYVIELYEHSKRKLKSGKTKKLYSILHSFFPIYTKEYAYIKSMFINFPEAPSALNNKFEFFELRDQIIHRGKVLIDKNELRVILDNIFVVNEIIRMMIPHLHKIGPTYMKSIDVYKANKMECTIELRREIIDRKINEVTKNKI
jgi:hypothetical protein